MRTCSATLSIATIINKRSSLSYWFHLPIFAAISVLQRLTKTSKRARSKYKIHPRQLRTQLTSVAVEQIIKSAPHRIKGSTLYSSPGNDWQTEPLCNKTSELRPPELVLAAAAAPGGEMLPDKTTVTAFSRCKQCLGRYYVYRRTVLSSARTASTHAGHREHDALTRQRA